MCIRDAQSFREPTVILITVWWLQKLGKKLAATKRITQKPDVKRFKHNKLRELEDVK
jgi:hypothetical protein